MQAKCVTESRARAGFVSAALIVVARLAVAGGDSWKATSTAGAPPGREEHAAVWTGSKMIVWGGYTSAGSKSINSGGIYDPAANTWSAMTTVNAPGVRDDLSAVWTGSKMIIFGGDSNVDLRVYGDGFAYDPVENSWAPISGISAPSARYHQTAVWTGSKMIVWGGWSRRITAAAPNPGAGVSDAGAVNTGGIYDPLTNTWTPTSTVNAPSPRGFHTVVWTGSKMVVWGGDDGTSAFKDLNTGGIYDPEADTWTATSLANAPAGRDDHSAVWTGTKMIVWGGYGNASGNDLNSGGVFDPDTNSWKPTNVSGAPSARDDHVAVWTGTKMIVWGGYTYTNHDVYFGNGALYDPLTDSWSAMTSIGAPTSRDVPSAVWTGSSMIAWAGYDGHNDVNSGGIYSPPAAPCPADGGRQCVTPVGSTPEAHSVGRNHQI